MQNFTHKRLAYKYFLAFLKEAGEGGDSSLLSEEIVREIVQEEVLKLFHSILPNADFPKQLPASNENIFIPFHNWQGNPAMKEKFFQIFIRERYITHSINDHFKPLLVSNNPQTGKIVWRESIGDLIYTFHHLVHTYKALPMYSNLKMLVYENVLFTDNDLKQFKQAKLNTYMTLYSRLTRQINSGIRKYRDIDDMLIEIFNVKES